MLLTSRETTEVRPVDAGDKQLAVRLSALGAHLRAGEVATVAALFATRRLEPGEALITEGQPTRTVFLLTEGTLAVKARVGELDSELGRLRPGALVGEIGFLDGQPATASVVAADDATVQALDRDTFGALERSHPRVAMQLMHAITRTLAGRIRTATDRLEALRGGDERPDSRGFIEAFRSLLGMGLS